VNGDPVRELATRVDPERDRVALDGHDLRLPRVSWVIALNKPPEFLVAARDMRGRRTVMELVRDVPERVFPVGRLDYRSEGLLLFTNDGDLAYRLAHPRYKVEKVYRVEVPGSVAPDVLEAFGRGVMLEEGRTMPARAVALSRDRKGTVLEIELREGRKRQIRRMLALFGHTVTRLRRIRFGPVELGDLPGGSWRELSAGELRALREAVGLPAAADGSELP